MLKLIRNYFSDVFHHFVTTFNVWLDYITSTNPNRPAIKYKLFDALNGGVLSYNLYFITTQYSIHRSDIDRKRINEYRLILDKYDRLQESNHRD
jgi:hypothetical protein